MAWLIVIFILIGTLTFLLLTPIIIFIDTATQQYYVRVKGLAKASLESDPEEVIKLMIKVPFKRFYLYPLRKSTKKKTTAKETKTVAKKKRYVSPEKLLKILKTFKVKRWLLDIDTGDYITNAKLYPYYGVLNMPKSGSFSINFEGRNRFVMHLQNSAFSIVRAII